MNKLIVDANNEVLGRVASFVAKQSLLGNEVIVINSEKAIISGNRTSIINKQKLRRALNTNKPEKGPFFSRDPEKMLRRAIRGMLPGYDRGRGKEAWKRIKCYVGTPEKIGKDKIIKIKTNLPGKKITLGDLSRDL